MASLLFKVVRRVESTHIVQPKTIRYVAETLQKHVSAIKYAQQRSGDIACLEGRTMNESRDSIAIPLGSEPSLRLQYMNYKNFVRFGKLLEDLDTFAVWISYKHNQRSGPMGIPSHHPMVIVTAAVDEIHIMADYNILPTSDISMEGFVSWVGRSSQHISMDLYQEVEGRRVNFLSARFVTVSQDPVTGRATPNMPLITTDPEQEEIVRRGRAAREIHKLDEEHSLLREPPNESERKLLHDIFLKTVDHNSHSFEHRRLPENHVWLEDAKLKNAIICFPIDRNVHGKIFGGYIMRLAFELAWSNAAIYASGRCEVMSVCEIIFRRPVEVGSLLLLSSQICYTVGDRMEVSVHAEIADLRGCSTQEILTSNTFYFMLKANQDVPCVIPKSYADSMLYIKAKRRYDRSENRL